MSMAEPAVGLEGEAMVQIILLRHVLDANTDIRVGRLADLESRH
jgi:hypothetical protein